MPFAMCNIIQCDLLTKQLLPVTLYDVIHYEWSKDVIMMRPDSIVERLDINWRSLCCCLWCEKATLIQSVARLSSTAHNRLKRMLFIMKTTTTGIAFFWTFYLFGSCFRMLAVILISDLLVLFHCFQLQTYHPVYHIYIYIHFSFLKLKSKQL